MGHTVRRVAAVVAAGALLLSGCTTGSSGPPAPSGEIPTAEPTPLQSYDTDGVAVVRSPFCDRVSPTGIERALDSAARSHRDYGNGDRIRLPDGTRGIAHEYGCEWTGSDGVTARAWVFVPPVTRARAGRLVDEALSGRCSRTGTGEFGTPSVATRCRTDGGVERSWRGLFGDAWLVCTLSGADAADVREDRTGQWCVSVLEAARA
jgi:hypothetical protein